MAISAVTGSNDGGPRWWSRTGVLSSLGGGRRGRSVAYVVLLVLGALDSAGYSVIGPVLPLLAERTDAGPAVTGALVSTFPVAMLGGFAAGGLLVRLGRARTVMCVSTCLLVVSALGFAAADALPAFFVARAGMGLGSGGLWMAVTFATLAYWPGQEYVCMSRIYAAYSVGALLGPLLGALGGVARPFAGYALLLTLAGVGVAALAPVPPATFAGDATVLRSRRFWVAAAAITLAITAVGMLDGVLPLHFASQLSQTQIGLLYALVACLIAGGSVTAGHLPAGPMVTVGAVGVIGGMTLAGATGSMAWWAAGLLLLGLGAGAAQTGATGLLLDAVPTTQLVTALVVWSQFGIIGYLAAPAVGGLITERVGFAAIGAVPAVVAAVLTGLVVAGRRSRPRGR